MVVLSAHAFTKLATHIQEIETKVCRLQHQRSTDVIGRTCACIRDCFDRVEGHLASHREHLQQHEQGYQGKLRQSQEQCSNVAQDLRGLEETRKEKSEELASLNRESDELNRDVQTTESEIRRLEDEQRRLEEEKKDAGRIVLAVLVPAVGIPVLVAKLNEIKDRIGASRDRKRRAQQACHDLRRRRDQVNREMQNTTRQVETLRQRKETMEKSIRNQENEIHALGLKRTRLVSLKEGITRMKNKYGFLRGNVDDLEFLAEIRDSPSLHNEANEFLLELSLTWACLQWLVAPGAGYIESDLNGFVLEADGRQSGAGVVMRPRNGSAAQKWTITETGQLMSHNGLVLDIKRSNKEQGASLVLWPKHSGRNQLWTFGQSGQIESQLNGLLLDVQWGDTSPGAKLHMWPNNGTNAQKWKFRPTLHYGQIESGLNGLVLEASHCPHAPVHMAPKKDGSAAQQWIWTSTGQLECKLNGLVLDIKASNREKAAEIILWQNHFGANQTWKMTNKDELESELNPSLVLDVKNGNKAPGATVQTWPKNGTAAQKWKFVPVSE